LNSRALGTQKRFSNLKKKVLEKEVIAALLLQRLMPLKLILTQAALIGLISRFRAGSVGFSQEEYIFYCKTLGNLQQVK
jgi:hypothetical protein